MAKDLVLSKAQNAVLAHDWSTAATLYKELLRGNESNVDYLKELGSIYVKAGEDEKAIPYYEQIITFYPHYIQAMNSLGAIFRRLKRYEESIRILQRAKDEGRDTASVNYNLGFTYKEMGNFQDAIEAFNSVIAENPDDVLAYNHLGSIYLAQKDYQKSITAYKRGLQVDPNHPILNYNLACCYEAAKSYPDAVRCYNAALKTRPGWTDAIRDYSGLLIKCQQTKAAQDLVEQSIKLHPMDTNLLYLLGDIYLHQFDYKNAAHTLKKADSIKGNDIKILSALAGALEQGAKTEEALEKVLEALDIDPENKDLQKQYVHTLLSAEDYDKALENLQELSDAEGEKDLEVLDLYGQYYICKDDEETAKAYYEKIKKIDHHYKNYMLEAADRYVQTGNYEKAEKYATSFIERRSKSPEGYAKLGKIYAASGKLQNARALYEKSLALSGGNVNGNSEIKRIDEELMKNPSCDEIVQHLILNSADVVEAEQEKPEAVEDSVEVAENIVPESVELNSVPSLHDLAENGADFDAAVFGEDDPDNIAEEAEAEETESEEENEIPSAEELGIDSLANSDDETPFDFNQMGDTVPLTDELAEEAENDFWNEFDSADENADGAESAAEAEAEAEPVLEPEPAPEPAPAPEAAPAPSPAPVSNEALASLLDTQRRALDLADRQMQMTEDFIKETVDAAVDAAVDKAVDEKMQEVLSENPSLASQEAESDVEDDGFGNLGFDEDEIMDETFMDVDSLENSEEESFEEPEAFDESSVYDEPEASEEDFVSVENFLEDQTEEESAAEEPAGEEIATDEPDEEPVEVMVDEQVEETEPVEENEPVEIIPVEELPLEEELPLTESADYMLSKIHKILSDTDLEAVSSDKIELFKMLRALLKFLPEGEKNTSITRRMNMLLAYLIEKLSGKPGLLATSESLIKSGVLGEEYLKNLGYEKSGEITNSLISKVLTDMKNLSVYLNDNEIAKALCASADGILEKIELEDQKTRIF